MLLSFTWNQLKITYHQKFAYLFQMPVNTRNTANRRTVPQTETSKCKKLPGFLLKGLNHTNNENQDEESSTYSDVEVCILYNLNFLIQHWISKSTFLKEI